MHFRRIYLTCLFALFLGGCNSGTVRQDSPSQTGDYGQSIKSTSSVAAVKSLEKETSNKTDDPDAETRSAVQETDNVWVKIQQNLSFDRQIHRRSVKEKINWYRKNQDYLDRVTERATPYLYHIVNRLEERNMPIDLALLPVVESAFQPFAYSHSRASGLWQFISATGKRFGLKQNWWYDGRRDVVAATDAALDYLEVLYKEFNGNWNHALASYNTGEKKVARAIKRNKNAGKPTDFWSLKLPRETRGYVPSLLAVAEIVANPAKYNIKLKTIPNNPYFVSVDTNSQIDLATAAKLADLSMDEIYTLNPGFNRWATDPKGPHHLLVPVAKAETFARNLAALPDSERISWKQHKIIKGESLGQIAQRYQTSVSALRQTNRLRGNLIREGRSLLIPTSAKPLKHYTLSAESRRFKGLKKTGDGRKYVYTVRRGDNLWDLSRTYGISVKQLTSWNGISRRSLLHPDQKLVVWIKDNENKDNIIKVVATKNEAINNNTYTVKKGDSLWLIARRFNIRVADLTKWNQLSKRRHLQPGQSLIIKSNATGA